MTVEAVPSVGEVGHLVSMAELFCERWAYPTGGVWEGTGGHVAEQSRVDYQGRAEIN